MTEVMGTRTFKVGTRLSGLSASSIPVTASGRESDRQTPPLLGALSRSVVRQHHQQQKARASHLDESTMLGRWGIIEPPFDLNALTDLLFDAPDYYCVVDQFAIDVAGMGWDLVDAENLPPQSGEVAPVIEDATARAQRAEAGEFFKTLARDFSHRPIDISLLCQCVIMDYDSTGNGYVEVSRDEKRQINGLFHVPSRLCRRRKENLGWVQINESEKPIAFFRDWKSDPDAETSKVSEEEAAVADRQEVGELKPELVSFRHYHSGELHYGVPPIISALSAVYGNLFSDSRNIRFFINKSLPDWLVEIRASGATYEDPETRTMIDRYEQTIKEHLQHVIQGDDYRVLILKTPTGEVETKWEKLNIGVTDQDFPVYQARNRDVQIRVYRMLPHRIGIIETGSLGSGTGESQEETYKRAQVDPRQRFLEEFFDQILDEYGWVAIRFKFREIDILDEQREIGIFAQAAATGCCTLNEERKWLSRIVKDQDFSAITHVWAEIPVRILDQEMAQMMGSNMPVVLPRTQIPNTRPGMGGTLPEIPAREERETMIPGNGPERPVRPGLTREETGVA